MNRRKLFKMLVAAPLLALRKVDETVYGWFYMPAFPLSDPRHAPLRYSHEQSVWFVNRDLLKSMQAELEQSMDD